MKKLIFSITCTLILAVQVNAQQETLFNRSKVFGIWGSPLMEFNFNDGINNSYGGGGGFIVDQFFLGAYGLGSSNIENLIENEDYRLDLAHGGLWLGYTHRPYKLLHPYASVRIGWGGVDIDLDDYDFEINDFDQVMVVTPEIGVELNVTRFFHIAATGGYRWVDGINNASNIGANDLNGFNLGLSFRLGWFGNWNKRNRDCD